MSAEPKVQLSFLLSLHNGEAQWAKLVRCCQRLGQELEAGWPGPSGLASTRLARNPRPDPPRFEILALDPSSTDNSVAVLSVLKTQVPELRCTGSLKPGHAFARASQIARGSHWLLSDRNFDERDAQWALAQIEAGKRAAAVVGELLVIEAELGRQLLARLQGGLATAQRSMSAHFQPPSRRKEMAWKRPSRWGLRRSVVQALRSRLGRVGLAALDRPRRDH